MKPQKFNYMTCPVFFWDDWKQVRLLWPRKINGRRYWLRKVWRRERLVNHWAWYREYGYLVPTCFAGHAFDTEWRLFLPQLVRSTVI